MAAPPSQSPTQPLSRVTSRSSATTLVVSALCYANLIVLGILAIAKWPDYALILGLGTLVLVAASYLVSSIALGIADLVALKRAELKQQETPAANHERTSS